MGVPEGYSEKISDKKLLMNAVFPIKTGRIAFAPNIFLHFSLNEKYSR
ncbi:hypothetical protein NEIPOLOT_00523 [Neisseria polysaccharea ATCC 43768]|nr:hypothetical protein NEIPOLOT_00523 [Neisseria polysaccharea ATCC 43768]